MYTLSTFHSFPGLVHGTSTRDCGDMRCFDIEDEVERRKFLETLQVPEGDIVRMVQKHTGNVAIVDKKGSHRISSTDGLVAKQKGVYLCAVTADCLPLLFYDNKKEVIGVAHAGYKGLLQGIIKNMIEAMKILGSQQSSIHVGIGPGIGVCCYEFGADKVSIFSAYNDSYQVRNGVYYVDLKGIAKQELIRNGIINENIEVADVCTKDRLDVFFSARAEQKNTYGEMATIIGMVEE